MKELNERQRQMNRNKNKKKGIDAGDGTRFPVRAPPSPHSGHLDNNCSALQPKVSIVSKYDRQIDRRNFRERRAMFDKVVAFWVEGTTRWNRWKPEKVLQKNAYPCFPNVPPPPALMEKTILPEHDNNNKSDMVNGTAMGDEGEDD